MVAKVADHNPAHETEAGGVPKLLSQNSILFA